MKTTSNPPVVVEAEFMQQQDRTDARRLGMHGAFTAGIRAHDYD